MAARLATSSSSLVVLAIAQPSPRVVKAGSNKNTMRLNAASNSSAAAVSAAAVGAPPTTKHSASTPRPDAAGRFGAFGGKYVPETLIAALTELEEEYVRAQADPAFKVRSLMDVGRRRQRETTHAWNDTTR